MIDHNSHAGGVWWVLKVRKNLFFMSPQNAIRKVESVEVTKIYDFVVGSNITYYKVVKYQTFQRNGKAI